MKDIKWIKICTDIFDDEKILFLENMPDGDAIIVIWFKLLCLAGKQNTNGVFILNDKIAYTDEMLAHLFRRPINTVRLALKAFETCGMIEIVDNIITIPNWEKHQNVDCLDKIREQNRKRVAAYRERNRQTIEKDLAIVSNVTSNVTSNDCNDMCNAKHGSCNVTVTEQEQSFIKDKNSLLKILKNRDSIASVYEQCKNTPRFSEINDEILDALAYAGSEIETLNFGDKTTCREDFERLITKPHGFDGNMLVETANAVLACKETIKDRKFYILGIIVNRFMR